MKKTIKEYFKESKREYKKYIEINKEMPTEKEWNKIAKNQNLLSSVSMRYIGNIKFKKGIF